MNRDILYTGVLGLAIGDALGVPFEFNSRRQMERSPAFSFTAGGVWEQPAGTWSDDTSMTLATIGALNKYDWDVTDNCLADIMNNFLRWYLRGDYAACGNRFDIGNTCEKAIREWRKHMLTEDNFKCTGVGGQAYGNGALMRILPCIFLHNDVTDKISRLTHNSKLCSAISIFYVTMIRYIMYSDVDKIHAFELAKEECRDILSDVPVKFMKVTTEAFMNTESNSINSSGYVIDTIEAAMWCFLNTDSYIDCIRMAVNLGDDSDTTAAVAGGIAGIYYGIGGEKGIPYTLISKLRDVETLRKVCFNNN